MAVFQSHDGRVSNVCACALLLILSVSSLHAEEIESSGIESLVDFAPFSTEQVDAAAIHQASPSPWPGDFWIRPQLSGDWGGLRAELAENGLKFFGDITQYYQGVTTGGLA